MRIASLLPSATEILYALGLGDSVIAVSERCDYPDDARRKPVVVRSRIDSSRAQAEIDAQVNRLLTARESLYQVDIEQLVRLQCDLLITQDVCHVCAASPQDLQATSTGLQCPARVISLNPHRLAEVWKDIEHLGEAAGRAREGKRLAAELAARTQAVPTPGTAPRVLCLEWFSPPFVAGHWVPEMVACAGGQNALAIAGEPGFATEWGRVLASNPDVIVLMPCGYDLDEVERQAQTFAWPEGWGDLKAVRTESVFVVDASGQFSRHGPRLADGVDTLRAILDAFQHGQSAGRRGAHWRRLAA
ncbi:MAG: cobalamin-binding protein [Terriglobales bacterium]